MQSSLTTMNAGVTGCKMLGAWMQIITKTKVFG